MRTYIGAPTDWPVIVDDGLLEANQLLRGDCGACEMFYKRDPHSSLIPKLLNVMVVSVQPERNIQLYPTTGELGSCPSVCLPICLSVCLSVCHL